MMKVGSSTHFDSQDYLISLWLWQIKLLMWYYVSFHNIESHSILILIQT